MERSHELKSKIDLIENFIEHTIPEIQDKNKIEGHFEKYIDNEKNMAVTNLFKKKIWIKILPKQYIAEYEFSGKIRNDIIKESFTESLGLKERRSKLQRIKNFELVENWLISIQLVRECVYMSEYQRKLETKLWAIADELRGNMDANEFKNYMLGFIFYKYLSEKIELYLNQELEEDGVEFKDAYKDDELREEVEAEAIENLGYFLEPRCLFKRWLKKLKKENSSWITYKRHLTRLKTPQWAMKVKKIL